MGLLNDFIDDRIKKSRSKVEEPSLLGALKDPQFRQDVKRGLLDSLNRGAVASTIGGPVDVATMLMRPLGYNVEKPVGGSEWVGDKMQQLGLLGDYRNPVAEALASVAVPGAMTKAGQGLFKAEQAAIQNANIAGPLSGGKFATQRGVFGGINAKTADKAKLAQAEQMLNKGVDPAQVWKETGWGRGPDGKWRFEISDKYDFVDTPSGDLVEVGANMLTGDKGFAGAIGSGGMPSGTVRQIMRHDDLFNAYPDAASIRLGKFDQLGGEYGADGIKLNGGQLSALQNPKTVQDIENVKSPLLHELQHAIQQREGFAMGGSPEAMAGGANNSSRINEINDILNSGKYSMSDYQKLLAEKRDLIQAADISPMEAYKRLGGEAEARLVQSRMNLTPEERAAHYPWNPDYFKQQTGVGLDDLIHRFDGGEAQMAIDPKGQKRLVQGLLGEGDGQRYRLGDITKRQAADAYTLGGAPVDDSLNVYSTPGILEDHARLRRMEQQNFSAPDVGLFANQAMRPSSVVIPPSSSSDYPVLRSANLLDPVSGRRYNSEMPLKPVDDGFEAVSIIPRGLPPRKKP